MKTVQEGWPESSRTLPIEVSPYFPFREEIVWMKGVLCKGNRCVIPKNMRQKILKRLHTAHSGVESCLKLAREYVFWPGITAQVKEHVRRCQTCAMTGPSLPKETWAAEDAPTRPWQIVGVDLFEFETRQYLIVTDYFSSFWEIDNMTSTCNIGRSHSKDEVNLRMAWCFGQAKIGKRPAVYIGAVSFVCYRVGIQAL